MPEVFGAPHSSINLPIGPTRRIATVHVELEELKNICSALGGTVNDVICVPPPERCVSCQMRAARTRHAGACARGAREPPPGGRPGRPRQ
ncbi:MAG: wax ester/triacylglycerol synthase domain-containing protein [Frankiaceae bacterium]